MKKILKIFIFLWLFLSLIWNVLAFDAKLKVENNTANINDTFNLSVEIESSEWWEIRVKNIKWLENFEMLWQSQSQSSSSQIVVVNWKTQSKTVSKVSLNLTLKPKKNWEFEIWPAILTDWKKEIKTNSVKIKVDWTNLGIVNNNVWNNIWIQQNKNIQAKQNIIPQNKVNNQNDIWKKEELKKQEKVEKNNYDLYILLWVLILSSIWFYFLVKNKQENKKTISDNKDNNNLENKEETEIDFESTKKEIIFPEVGDANFIEKITKSFREKVSQEFKIKDIESLTLSEILDKTWKKDNIKQIVDILNKAKYSNIIEDKSKILELVKEI